MSRSFAEVRQAAPPIHAFVPAHKTLVDKMMGTVTGDKVTILEPNTIDEQYSDTPFGSDAATSYVAGDGNRKTPYTLKSAAPMSAHYGMVGLWWLFQLSLRSCKRPVYIKVNDWIFEITPEGVIALDGTLTKLI